MPLLRFNQSPNGQVITRPQKGSTFRSGRWWTAVSPGDELAEVEGEPVQPAREGEGGGKVVGGRGWPGEVSWAILPKARAIQYHQKPKEKKPPLQFSVDRPAMGDTCGHKGKLHCYPTRAWTDIVPQMMSPRATLLASGQELPRGGGPGMGPFAPRDQFQQRTPSSVCYHLSLAHVPLLRFNQSPNGQVITRPQKGSTFRSGRWWTAVSPGDELAEVEGEPVQPAREGEGGGKVVGGRGWPGEVSWAILPKARAIQYHQKPKEKKPPLQFSVDRPMPPYLLLQLVPLCLGS